MIELVSYDPAWPARFAAEAQALRQALGARVARIEHVGSTAVPGLAAKPVIDIQVSVADLEPRAPLAAALAALGYAHVALDEFDRVYPFFCKPPQWPSTHHVHLCVAGSELEAQHLRFRDALRADAQLAQRYLALKRRLAAEHDGATLDSRERYSLGKTGFVRAALAAPLKDRAS